MKKISLGSISDFSSAAEREQYRQVSEARVAVVTWKKLARKSSGQVRAFLRQKGYASDIIQLTLESLAEDGTVDDRILADKLVRQRQGRSAESSAALKQRLRYLGLAENVIEAAIPDEGEDETVATELLKRRYGNGPMDSRKATRFLAGRGFSSEVINRVLCEQYPDVDVQE